MKTLRRSLFLTLGVIQLLLLLATLSRPAYGYVDPGSGLLAVQVGGSMLAGALFMLRIKLRKLLRLAPRKDCPENSPAEAE